MTEVLILGAGAAGLMCALTAASRGLAVTLVDHGPVTGRKVRMAGGGKGNVTNLHMHPRWYVGEDPTFCTQALRRLPPERVLDLLARLGLAFEEREYGQIFCLESAARLVEALEEECVTRGVTLLLHRDLGEIRRVALSAEATGITGSNTNNESAGSLFEVETSEEFLRARQLVIALGSPAWPAVGATDRGLRLARQWGHKIFPVRPVLAPLVMPESWPLHGLAGISAKVRVDVPGHSFTLPLLFTHRGVSGPAVLQLSCFWRPGMEVRIDFLPENPVLELMHAPENGRLTVGRLLRRFLAERLVERLLALLPEPLCAQNIARWGRGDRATLAALIHEHRVVPGRTEGMGKAEAAAGGVDTSAVHPRTMESRLMPGLFFAGEVLDVTGLLGGYNLHWAWASGKAAGEALRKG